MTIQGIENGSCEHFVKDGRLVTICNGAVYYDFDIPDFIINLREKELKNDVEAQAALNQMNIFGKEERLIQFCKCRYGGNDDAADTIQYKGSTPDYWNCGKRGLCKAEFCLCSPIMAEHGQLSRTEIKIIKLIAQDLADKQIAEKMELCENTIHSHRYNITKKIGCSSKNGIVAFAYEKGILNNK